MSVRLACLIHAASVRSEPESNSPLKKRRLTPAQVFPPRHPIKTSLVLPASTNSKWQIITRALHLSHNLIFNEQNQSDSSQVTPEKFFSPASVPSSSFRLLPKLLSLLLWQGRLPYLLYSTCQLTFGKKFNKSPGSSVYSELSAVPILRFYLSEFRSPCQLS
jgi:hypothetical protein